jgi:hypothetical protein
MPDAWAFDLVEAAEIVSRQFGNTACAQRRELPQ